MSTPTAAITASGQRDPPPGGDARLAPAYELIASGGIRALSLDVFDTVVFRLVPQPSDLFTILGQRLQARGALAPGLSPGAFASLRRTAERHARQQLEEPAGSREAKLGDIWSALPATYRGALDVQELVDAELEVERHMLRPDLDVLELIHHARDQGIPVAAVSDTYLSATQLRRHVLDLPPLEPELFDLVLTSSDQRVGKASGLFERLLVELEVKAGQVVHVGDNIDADIAPARALGINPVHVSHRSAALGEAVGREWAYRREWLHPAHGDYGLTALRGKLAGRTELADMPPELRAFWRWGGLHLGPVMTGFANWVAERTEAAGATRAHCLMREGDLLVGLVEHAAKASGRELAVDRLWLSRQVCARALILEGSSEELARLIERRRPPLVGELAGTLGLDVNAHAQLRSHAQARLDDPALVEHVLSVLTLDPDAHAQVVANAAVLRARVLRSLEPVLPDGGEPLIVVDVGWGATIQWYLDRLLSTAGTQVGTRGLYLLTHEGALQRMVEGVSMEGFLSTGGYPGLGVSAIVRSPELLEQVCMPDFGSQIDIDERLAPVLGAEPAAPLQHAQRLAARQGIQAFQREWIRYRTATSAGLPDLTEGGQDALLAITARALVAPTPDEAALFEAWLHDENYGSERVDPISGGALARALSHLDPAGLTSSPMQELYWPFGLAAMADPELARATELSELGLASPETFSAPADTGGFQVFADSGAGFSEAGKSIMQPRRNRRGLSYARGRVTGVRVDAVRIDPADRPCLVRIDWLSLRCSVRGRPEPETVLLDQPEQLAELSVFGLQPVAPRVFLATGTDPQIHVDLRDEERGTVYQVEVECGFASLAVPSDSLAALSSRRGGAGRLGAEVLNAIASPARLARLPRRLAKLLGLGRVRARLRAHARSAP